MLLLKAMTLLPSWSIVQIQISSLLYITSNRYNLSPVQLSVLTKDWAGLDRPEVDEGIVAIRTAASSEESSAKWDKLQSFLYEYGAASVLGHYSGLMATSADVEGFNYFDFPLIGM